MCVRVRPAPQAPRGAIHLVLALILAATQATNSFAGDETTGRSRIDLTQLQNRAVDIDSAGAADSYSNLRIKTAAAADLFGLSAQANLKSAPAQSGTEDLRRSGRNEPDADPRTKRTGSNNYLNSSQGDLGMLLVAQRGEHNDIQVSQSGSGNTGFIDQSGSHNVISGYQGGANNAVSITQAGTNQVVVYAQTGSGSTLTVRQR